MQRRSHVATAAGALAFVRRHGIVLLSARGPVPSLAAAIAGEPIRGSWWVHPQAHRIHALASATCESTDVLVCRLVGGKVTLVHRRVWPALVRLAGELPRRGLALVREEHTPQGHHRTVEVPFPRWVPRDVRAAARALTEEDARSALGGDLLLALRPPRPRRD
jgi:hypothetical protein